jgi:transposase-like protein
MVETIKTTNGEGAMNIVKIYKMFPSQEDCLEYLEQIRWNGQPTCPYCQSKNSTPMPNEYRHHCNNCNTSYSVTVGTIFHKTHLDLQRWFLSVSLILNAKKGISARQLARDLDVNKNTAWYMGMRIRKAMCERWHRELLQGVIEMDETYIGGKPRKGNDGKPKGYNKRGRGTKKTPVVGMIERGGNVKAEVRIDRILSAKKLQALAKTNIDLKNSTVITDEFKSYKRFNKITNHKVINHTKCYSIGDINTNSMESFWALLQRGITGQYHKVSIKHLPEYVDEFCYRFNNNDNADVFELTIKRSLGVVQ